MSLPLQGEGQDGDGSFCHIYPIPTPTLPLKGREFGITELKLVPLIPEPDEWEKQINKVCEKEAGYGA